MEESVFIGDSIAHDVTWSAECRNASDLVSAKRGHKRSRAGFRQRKEDVRL